MTDETLSDVYSSLHGFGPEFGGDEEGRNALTNHGPMAAEVIVRRDLDIDVERWSARYSRRLVTLDRPGGPIHPDDWRAALGDGRRLADWIAFYRNALAETSWSDVLALWWPRLLPGVIAGSTHGLIRVSHAVRTLSAGPPSPAALEELAHALAFWAARSREIAGVAVPSGRLSVRAALDSVPRLPDQTGVIADRITRLGALEGWTTSLAAVEAPTQEGVDAALHELIEAASIRYLTAGPAAAVLLVHTATAPNAVRHVLPHLPREQWVASYATAWVASAAVTAMYAPRTSEPASPATALEDSPDPVVEVLGRAAEHGDEHVLKFTDTAVESYERSGRLAVLEAALLCATLIDPA